MPEIARKRKRESGDGSIFLRGRIWWIQYYLPGIGKKSESSRSTDRKYAEKILTERLRHKINYIREIQLGAGESFHCPKCKRVITMEDIEMYRNYKKLLTLENKMKREFGKFYKWRKNYESTCTDVSGKQPQDEKNYEGRI
jgi:hypothetical protein